MTETGPVYVSLEFTPNPNTLKYVVNRRLLEAGAVNVTQAAEAAQKSPLAAALFEIEGIAGVMLGRDFVTVTKSEDGDWEAVHGAAQKLVESFLNEGREVVNLDALSQHGAGGSEVANRVTELLDKEIRPAVAMDGGDITFDRYEDGVVYLQLQGSCAGCPSATATLKQGIEARLKQLMPEVREVVSV